MSNAVDLVCTCCGQWRIRDETWTSDGRTHPRLRITSHGTNVADVTSLADAIRVLDEHHMPLSVFKEAPARAH